MNEVCAHSEQALAVYKALVEYNNKRVIGPDIGAKLTQLARALRAGGARAGGEEFNAGAAANLGISDFYDYWTSLPAPQKMAILSRTPELESILNRLFRPNDANFKEVVFCVELTAGALDPIISMHNNTRSLQQLKANFEEKLQVLKAAIENPYALDITHYRNVMTGAILGEAYKLPETEQQAIFAESGSKNALFYALEHSPKDLIFFELDDLAKQEAINARFNSKHDPAIVIAAKKGQFKEGIKTLLDWGADIEARDSKGSNALHWAAFNGKPVTTAGLLSHGADIDALGDGGNTALMFAISKHNASVVNLLLEHNASFLLRNKKGFNALDFAIKSAPQFIEPLLLRMVLLPIDQQALCFLNCSKGPYPHALAYAAAEHPALFPTLVNKILELEDDELKRDILNANPSPLRIAVHHRLNDIVVQLLATGLVDINARNNKGYSALYWAVRSNSSLNFNRLVEAGATLDPLNQSDASLLRLALMKGNFEMFDKLLDMGRALLTQRDGNSNDCLGQSLLIEAAKLNAPTAIEKLISYGADIDLQSRDGTTALHWAVKSGHSEAVDCLLRHDASLSLRDQEGYTPLGYALRLNRKDISIQLINKSKDINDLLFCLGGQKDVEIIRTIIIRLITLSHQTNSGHAKTNTNGIDLYRYVIDYGLVHAFPVLLHTDLFSSVDETIVTTHHNQLKASLNRMGFDRYLIKIFNHYLTMVERARSNPNYKPAVESAKELLLTCVKQKQALFMSQEGDVPERLNVFKERCKEAISVARPELKKYRQWGKILAEFLVAIITFPISLPLYAFNLFSTKSKSEQLVDKLEGGMDQDVLPKKV